MLKFDPLYQPFPSQRNPIYARGMVNCSSPLAAAAGLEMLQKGGNAMDAIVAAAMTLTVVEPTANGIGADAFCLIWSEKDQKLYGLNSSGPAPMLATPERVHADYPDGGDVMPQRGWAPVTVPGAPKAWAGIVKRFGKLSLPQVASPAVRYARDGFPCPAGLSDSFRQTLHAYQRINAPFLKAWFETFAKDGKPWEPGQIIRLPDHACSLEEIGATDAESFYQGALARKIDQSSREGGGYLRLEDLAAFEAQWVEPISVHYRGVDVCEIPPNGQGIVALMALNILKNFDFQDRDAIAVHRQIEALEMAFADAFRSVTDPKDMDVDIRELLQDAYGVRRAQEMTDHAQIYSSVLPPRSGTVYLCAGDPEGNLVSYIQSNYMGFGSGVVVPGTGIALQNRGADFSLRPGDANLLSPGKRSYHTIIPGFLMQGGKPLGPFGVMGGYMQPQGHVQTVMNLVDFHLDPQQALSAPRFQWMRDGKVTVERSFPEEIALALRRMGHDLQVDLNTPSFGRGQMILRMENGALIGGTEPRTDSNIACL